MTYPDRLKPESIGQGTLLLDIATRNIVHLSPAASIGDAARLMAEKQISSIVVTCEQGNAVGIVTERNMLRAMQSGCPPATPLAKIMSSPVISVPATTTCLDAYQRCLRNGIRHLLLLDDEQRLAGVVSETDFRHHINLAALSGKRQVAAVMNRSLSILPRAGTLQQALNLMEGHRDTAVIVAEDDVPLGIVTERDVVRLYSSAAGNTAISVGDVMTSPLLTVSLDDSTHDAAERMLAANVRHLVVVDGAGRMAGMISEHDLTQTMTLGLLDDKMAAEGAFLHTLMQNISDMVWLKDLQGNYLACNRPLEVFFGATEKEIVGKSDYDFLGPEQAEFFCAQDKMALDSNGAVTQRQWVTYAADGRRELLEIVKTPMRDSRERLLGVLGVARNITEHHFLQEKMARQLAFTRAIIDTEAGALAVCHATDEYPHVAFTVWNPGMMQLTGYSLEEINRLGWYQSLYVDPEIQQMAKLRMEKMRQGDHLQGDELVIIRKDGEQRLVQIHTTTVIEDERGAHVLAVMNDVTASRKMEAELRIAACAFESQEGMLISDANNVILRVNSAFTRITGYSAEEVVGQTPRIISSGRQDENFYKAMWSKINHCGSWEGEIWNRRKNGEVYPEFLTITAVRDSGGQLSNYIATFNDITLRKTAEEEIRSLAFYDPLTRLPNRRLLVDRLRQALASSSRSGREGALLFIDLDNFKSLNDTLGHDIGDLLLQQVAQRLQACVRECDSVARLGGDEFVVMLEDLSENALEAAEQTEAVAEKILASLRQSYQLGLNECRSTPSIGAALFRDGKQEIEELFKQADIAMYQAKKSGRNTLRFFDPQMQEAINTRASMEDELRQALDKRQFSLYYQIQVDSSNHSIGAEALIRWAHPTQGLVSPAQFIPLAEETGLIVAIGKWVLETACAQLKSWQLDSHTCERSLSVNVSAKQFRQDDFVAQVLEVVRKHDLDPRFLKLELTESMLLDNVEETIATMKGLKEIGVQFALDDFGTGYSSLQYLKRLPLDQLKIDQSFVRDLAEGGNDSAIVRTIVAMANSLNLKVIAEGVETEEQGQLLLDSGCTNYQGYYYGRPVPIEQFESALHPE